MTRNGRAYRQRLWVPAISGTGGGALPTPVAQTGAGGPKGLDGGSGARQMLTDAGFPRAAGAPSSLPTPRAAQGMLCRLWSPEAIGHHQSRLEDFVAMLPTPCTCSAMASPVNSRGNLEGERFPNLETVIGRQLLTPCANDWKGRTNWEAAERHGPQRLPDCLPTGAATYLNPSFVEEMMGYPVGWTA